MGFNSNNLKIHKLTSDDSLEKYHFDCGDDDLNDFLFNDSFKYIKNNLAVIYLIFYNKMIVGYFSLTSDAIRINKKLEVVHGFYPAVKIGRFAVDKQYGHQGIGTYMLKLIIGIVETVKNQIGVRYLSVDAYNNKIAVNFYTKNNFETLQKARNREQIPMYYDIEFKEDNQ